MNTKKNSELTPNAQQLRREMTKQERHLWYDFLKGLPYTFHRQKVIGHYIVDFYCAEKNIVIELDGRQHRTEDGKRSDAERDRYLKGLGITVLRYPNQSINKEFRAICEDILSWLK